MATKKVTKKTVVKSLGNKHPVAIEPTAEEVKATKKAIEEMNKTM